MVSGKLMDIFLAFLAVYSMAVLVEFLNDLIVQKSISDTEADARLLRALANKHRKSFDEVWKD